MAQNTVAFERLDRLIFTMRCAGSIPLVEVTSTDLIHLEV
jgi:hypothetical protein